MVKKKTFDHTTLFYTKIQPSHGILIDPADQWSKVREFIEINQIDLKYLAVTEPSFSIAFDISRIQMESGAKFVTFQKDLLQLRNLPLQANVFNICGVKVPHVDSFLDDVRKIVMDDVVIHVRESGNVREYFIDAVEITHES